MLPLASLREFYDQIAHDGIATNAMGLAAVQQAKQSTPTSEPVVLDPSWSSILLGPDNTLLLTAEIELQMERRAYLGPALPLPSAAFRRIDL